MVIQCDNQQTLRLVTAEIGRLNIKLKHVDIHNHWLCQEYAERRVLFDWTPMRDMIANGLTKALSPQRHEVFVKLIKLDDITQRIELEKRMEALQDQLQDRRAAAAESPDKAAEMVFMVSRGVKTRGIGLHLHLDI